MATGTVKNHAIRFKTFSVDCTTTATQLTGYYCGEKALTTADLEGAYLAVPVFARKSGYNYPITFACENNTIRLLAPASYEAVNVGVVLFYQ